MPVIKVGRLVHCIIVKDMPRQEMYLVLIKDTEMLGYIPKKSANARHAEGDEVVAAIFIITGGKIFLSQRSPQFFRRIAEEMLSPAIKQGKIKVRRAAAIANSAFAKVVIEGIGTVDPLTVCLPLIEKAKDYTPDTMTIVRYSSDIKEFIVNALVPAPPDKVVQVLYSHSLREAIVRVDPQYCGFFVGKGGSNVATAAKLLDMKIVIKGAEQGMNIENNTAQPVYLNNHHEGSCA